MDFVYVEDFGECSSTCSTESNDGLELEAKPKRKRSAPRVWQKIRDFETPKEAETYVSKQVIWKKSSTKSGLAGTKVEYRCTAGKYRVNECPAGLYLLYHATSAKVSLFQTECDHDNHDTDPSRGLPVEIKNFARSQFEEGVQKPNAILAAIRRKGLPEPPKSKLIAYLKRMRQETGRPTLSAWEIHRWCTERKDIPAEDDEPFVLDFSIHAESPNFDEQDLKIVMSTRRLLRNLRKSLLIQIDGTHKVVWQGYPVMVIGTSDKTQNFHPFGLAICKEETVEDFSFIFQAFHKFDAEWEPQILLGDGNEDITKGFRAVFGEPTVRITCFSHVMKNLETQFMKGFQKETRIQLKDDIQALQTCMEQSSFLKATQLFLTKWRGSHGHKLGEFLDYLEGQWIAKRSSWYEGAALGYPSTNNGIEATYSTIKSEHTFRERLPVEHFLNNVLHLLEKWSKSRDPTSENCIHFAEARSIPLSEWITAYQWAVKNEKVLQQSHQDPHCSTYFTNSSAARKEITPEDASTYQDSMGKWSSFEEFKRIYYGTWKIELNKENLEASKCSCPYYLKYSSCKHVLGMQIRLKLVQPPPESVQMGPKRKRGRPSAGSKDKRAILVH